jgi:hypothetical protein
MVKSLVVRLINGIEELEQAALRESYSVSTDGYLPYKSYSEAYPNKKTKLGEMSYCPKKDTFKLLYKRSESDKYACYSCFSGCSLSKELMIPFSIQNIEPLLKYLGKDYLVKLMKIFDEWPSKENNFPSKNSVYLNLPEHKELENLFKEWNNLPEEKRFDEFLDFESYLSKREDILDKTDEFLKIINQELEELEREL